MKFHLFVSKENIPQFQKDLQNKTEIQKPSCRKKDKKRESRAILKNLGMKIGIKIGRKNTQPMIEAERINESSPSYSRLRIEEGWRGARRLAGEGVSHGGRREGRNR